MSYTFKSLELESAWAGGFFDGEGCVMIHRRVRGRFIEHYVTAVVGQKAKPPLLTLQKRYRGILTKLTTSGCYQWRAHGKTAEAFYISILPFCRFKSDEIELALKIRATVGTPGKRVPKDTWLLREKIWKEFRAIREAKKRGSV